MAGVLLDAHTYLWIASKSRGLGRIASQTLALRSTVAYVSVVSLWEIAIKAAQGSLKFDDPLDEVFAREFETNGYVRLDIADRHLAELLQLPHPALSHGDPFDRLLAAQARAEGLELLSADPKLDAYGIRRTW